MCIMSLFDNQKLFSFYVHEIADVVPVSLSTYIVLDKRDKSYRFMYTVAYCPSQNELPPTSRSYFLWCRTEYCDTGVWAPFKLLSRSLRCTFVIPLTSERPVTINSAPAGYTRSCSTYCAKLSTFLGRHRLGVLFSMIKVILSSPLGTHVGNGSALFKSTDDDTNDNQTNCVPL